LKYIIAFIAIFTTHDLDQTYGDRVRSGCISEWWDILLNKIILSEQLHNNFIIYFSVCIISVSFCVVLCVRSKMNVGFLNENAIFKGIQMLPNW